MSTRTRSSFFGLLAVLAVPLLMGAKGVGCGGEVAIGDDKGECATTECGAVPAIACWDGSSPYTGKCLAKTDGTCAWEPRDCPPKPTECSTCAIPDIACADGTSPYTGKCFQDAAGVCKAEYKGCGTTKKECTPCAVPSIACADGSIPYTGKCYLDASGACTPEYKGCPSDKCTDTECGPVPPVAPCSDGTGPSIACERRSDGTCGWNVGTCPVSACDKVTSYPRACVTKSDCAWGLHQVNCCGSEHAMGFSKSASSTFAADEKACDATYPGCGCAASPTVDDSGKTGLEFDVDCVGGACTTFVTKGL